MTPTTDDEKYPRPICRAAFLRWLVGVMAGAFLFSITIAWAGAVKITTIETRLESVSQLQIEINKNQREINRVWEQTDTVKVMLRHIERMLKKERY